MDAYPHSLVDGHVHFHPQYRRGSFLNAAADNFALQAGALNWGTDWVGILMLSEVRGRHWFQDLLSEAEQQRSADSPAGWRFAVMAGLTPSILARHPGRPDLLIIPGRQIITSEGLEVLALATASTLKDGLPLLQVLEWTEVDEAIAVIPWGAGKWLGRRGDLVDQLIRSDAWRQRILLGDSGGRPVAWCHPRHLETAHRLNIRVLPGTDPLPLAGEELRVGSYGAMIAARLDMTYPTAALKRLIRDPNVPLNPYGNLQTNTRFVRNQIRLRLRKVS